MPSLVLTLVALVYPAFCSSKALQEKDLETATQWLAYWMIYTAFTCVEPLLDIVLGFFPLYAEAKLCFILWLQLPYFKGAPARRAPLRHMHLPPSNDPSL